MTYEDIYNGITARVNDTSSATTNIAKANINFVQKDVCSRHPFSWLLAPGTITTTASQAYSVISTAGITDCWKIWTIREADTPRMLTKIPMKRWEEFQVLSSNEGIPTHYSDEYYDRIYWYPTPDDAYSMYARYFKQISDLSAVGDESVIPSRYHEVLVIGGWAKTLQYLKMYNEAEALKAEYEAFIQKMIDDDEDSIDLVEQQEDHIIGSSLGEAGVMPARYRRT